MKHSESIPLVVGLDGTLLRTDLLSESGLRLIKQKHGSSYVCPCGC